jgi:hypothetical protein
MPWKFRQELIAELQKISEVFISMPFNGHEDDFKNMGCGCIETKFDRRSINPFKELKLFVTYEICALEIVLLLYFDIGGGSWV